MALEGTIRDFGLPDIFQLIGLQRKTGILTLTNEKDAESARQRSVVVHRKTSWIIDVKARRGRGAENAKPRGAGLRRWTRPSVRCPTASSR